MTKNPDDFFNTLKEAIEQEREKAVKELFYERNRLLGGIRVTATYTEVDDDDEDFDFIPIIIH